MDEVPVWGALPLWVVVLIFGRELFMTIFRSYAARQGVVIAAGVAGKRKALFQNLFIGATLLWFPLARYASQEAWNGWLWTGFEPVVRWFSAITLGVAIVLTVYSMIDYLWSYRAVVGMRD